MALNIGGIVRDREDGREETVIGATPTTVKISGIAPNWELNWFFKNWEVISRKVHTIDLKEIYGPGTA